MKRATSSLLRQRHASSKLDVAGRPYQRTSAPLVLVRHSHSDHHNSPVSSPVKRGVLFDAHREEGSSSSSNAGGSSGSNNARSNDKGKKPDDGGAQGGWFGGGVWDTALGIAAGTILLGAGGTAYFAFYKWNVLRKMEIAFKGGYDPVLELEKAARAPSSSPARTQSDGEESQEPETRIRRVEQDMIDRIIKGEERGHYYLLLGPKGSGKTSMMIQSMLEIDADGIAVCEAHEDPEVFKLRFSKAINYENHEDSYNGLFQRRDPKEAGPLLDIERAMSKLEKVAIRYRRKHGKPLVLVFNNMHFLKDDEAGQGVLHLIQQRAEAWAASQCANIVINSDDFRIYDLLKKNANRMMVLSIKDLGETDGIAAIRTARRKLWGESMSQEDAREIYDLVGGRMSIVMSLAKHRDMKAAARDKVEMEKQWLLSKIGLIPDHDDDVMDEQKWSSCSWLLLQELAKKAETTDDPKVTWFRAREVMTRPDFLSDLDHLNVIQIDTHYNVRPDSKLLLNVMKEVVNEEDFQERLDSVMDRVNAIESLHRTRELTLKDGPGAEGVFKIMLAPPAGRQRRSSWFWNRPAADSDAEASEGKDGDDD